MFLANTRVVVASVDVVSRLEATFVCLVLYGWGVDGMWWQPCPSFELPHVQVRCRAIGWHRLADQVITSAQSKQVEVECIYTLSHKSHSLP
jgi:hypothetical protein